jgi:glycerol-3-phosphate dehydrogenase (NAD(P)+)
MSKRVAVVGAGSWGTALANVLSQKGDETVLWSRGDEVADLINSKHENRVYLPGIGLDERLRATTDLAEAVTGASLVVMVVPSHAMREVIDLAAPHLHSEALIVNASKGIEDETSETMFDVIEDAVGPRA